VKRGFTDGIFFGGAVIVGGIFAFVLFARFLEWTSPIGEMTREELAPWVFIGIPVLFIGTYFLDRWLKNDL
jgi:hypothetical protein